MTASSYDRISRYYDSFMRLMLGVLFGGERKFREDVLGAAEIGLDERVLEIACGTGTFMRMLKEKVPGCSVTGVDQSLGMIEIARRKSDIIEYIVGDAGALDVPGELFDKVYISLFLHEVDDETRMSVLNETRRVLRNDGKLIVSEWKKADTLRFRLLEYIESQHGDGIFKGYVEQDLPEILERANFKIVDVIPTLRNHGQIIVAEKAG